MKPKLLLIIVIIVCSIQACADQIPRTARELAISTLCDFPAESGENMCQRVDVTQVMVEYTLLSNSQPEGYLKKWCIELHYIDYTGGKGIACVWLVGPTDEGEYMLSKGPLLNVKCVGSR